MVQKYGDTVKTLRSDNYAGASHSRLRFTSKYVDYFKLAFLLSEALTDEGFFNSLIHYMQLLPIY